MPKWLRGILAPTLSLWLCVVAVVTATVFAPEGPLPLGSELAGRTALSMILAWWVVTDARKRGWRLCHDYDAFIFFAWPIVIPVYLFQTRGFRALLTFSCFLGIWLLAGVLAVIALLLIER